MNVLILGGTTEASALARLVAADGRLRATLSLAGRTRNPLAPPVAWRIGGLRGACGLAAYLREQRIDALVDATHPFAAQMSRHAAEAAARTGTKLLAIHRPAWTPQAGDRWRCVPSMAAAADALGAAPVRALLTVGQQELMPFAAKPQHCYVVRSVDPPREAPAGAVVLTGRGPFAEADERRLLERHRIDVLVTKNSGGTATRAKLDAARALGIAVVMVARPVRPPGLDTVATDEVATAEAAMAWLAAHAGTLRGE